MTVPTTAEQAAVAHLCELANGGLAEGIGLMLAPTDTPQDLAFCYAGRKWHVPEGELVEFIAKVRALMTAKGNTIALITPYTPSSTDPLDLRNTGAVFVTFPCSTVVPSLMRPRTPVPPV